MKQIQLCPNCKGEGKLEQRDRSGYESVTCTRCAGTGRVETRTYSFDLPFGSQLDPKIEEQIFNLIKQTWK